MCWPSRLQPTYVNEHGTSSAVRGRWPIRSLLARRPPPPLNRDREVRALFEIHQRAHDELAVLGVDVEDDVGVVGVELVWPASHGADDEDVVGAGLNDVGDGAHGLTRLVDDRESDQLVKIELAGSERARVG